MAVEQSQGDPLLRFIDHAMTVLSSDGNDDEEREEDHGGALFHPNATYRRPTWNWIASRLLRTCAAYSSGVTAAIILSDLFQAWNSEQQRDGVPKKRPEYINQLRKKQMRPKLPNTVTIDSVFEKKFLSLSGVLEVVIVDAFFLPGTNIYMLTLADFWSSNTIDLYLHRRYYELGDPQNGLLKKGREILLTGCYLRSAAQGSAHPRLLPTEYLVIVLDEDEDDDAMLIGAQFCSDSFSSISLDEVNRGVSYSLYARIEFIGPLEIHGNVGSLQRKQIKLVDEDGVKLNFLLWGEQVLLANLFSVGSMLGLDRPYVSTSPESGINEICLEYGSATQLYVVPFIQCEEQVCVTLTQSWCQGSAPQNSLDSTPGPKVSQVSLPRDSQGSVDFSSYPFRSFVTDLHDKMTGISLYGVVTHIKKEKSITKSKFSIKIQDSTGTIWTKLCFSKSWSLGRLSFGHTVYISGLTCTMMRQKCLEASWVESDTGSSFVNLSYLSALLNSPCLQRLSSLSNLPTKLGSTQIASVWLEMAHFHVNTPLSHTICGHLVNNTPNGLAECELCGQICAESEIALSFHLKITLADETGKIFAWSSGQTATELLQILPEEFHQLPEEEQIMYPTSLENERFMVALVYCEGLVLHESNSISWEITRALKFE